MIFSSIFRTPILFIIRTPILCCTTTDLGILGIFWYCSGDFWSCICESPDYQLELLLWRREAASSR